MANVCALIKTFFFAAIFKLFFYLYMHIWPRMNVILDFISTLLVQLRGTEDKSTFQKKLSTVGFETPTWQGVQVTSHRLNHTVNSRLLCMQELNVNIMRFNIISTRLIHTLEHLSKQRINMVCIAVAALPWYKICTVLQIYQCTCRYFITVLTIFIPCKTEMHNNWHNVDAIYMHVLKIFIDRIKKTYLHALYWHLISSFIAIEK